MIFQLFFLVFLSIPVFGVCNVTLVKTDTLTQAALGFIPLDTTTTTNYSTRVHPQTSAGNHYFNTLLKTPIADIAELKKRQEIPTTLIINNALYTSIDSILHQIQMLEPELLTLLYDQQLSLKQEEVCSRYRSYYLNDKAWFKNIFLGRYASFVRPLLPCIALALPDEFKSYTTPLLCLSFVYEFIPSIVRKSFSECCLAVWCIVGPTITHQGVRKIFSPGTASIIKSIATGTRALSIAFLASHEYRVLYPIECEIRKKMVCVAKFIRLVQELSSLIETNPILSTSSINFQSVLADIEKHKDAAALLEIVKTSTFEGPDSFLSNVGRIMVAHDHFMQCKAEISKLMEAVGACDAYHAITGWISSEDKICAADYVDCSKPFIYITDFVHPELDTTAIANSFILDGSNTNIVCITGANRSGKSVCAKSIMGNIWLAQTIGFCNASEMRLTPLKQLYYITRTTDIVGKLSSFEAELNTISTILNSIQEDRSFVIFDEAFTSTDPQAGKESLEHILTYIAQNYSNCCTVAVSHYKDLALPTVNEVHYHMACHKNDNGSLQPTYLLAPGQSYENDAIYMVNQHLEQLSL